MAGEGAVGPLERNLPVRQAGLTVGLVGWVGRSGWPVGLVGRAGWCGWPVRLPVGLPVRLAGLAAGTKPACKAAGKAGRSGVRKSLAVWRSKSLADETRR